jgi:para-aminobenzoate synthetase/4-amino-4-deoxychorismate lyase
MPAGRAYAGPLTYDWDEARYAHAFDQVKTLIASGDIYQANLSLRARFAFAGDPKALYRRLQAQSAAAHCAYVDEGDRQILSLSPELFFDLSADGVLTARPMKGTAESGGETVLAQSAKDRAENLMIVDLIRNDLGRIAEIGSVQARDLFRIETYPTLHAMVSTVTARLKPGAAIADILKALFPCGSITGAPKIRAMEVLRKLEDAPRGPYCGAIGFFAPDGAARFNVAIRTMTLRGGEGVLGLGGGVVQDSTAAAEYAECQLKARFFETGRPKLALIETLKFDGAFQRLERHLARMEGSARLFGFAFDEGRARAALTAAIENRSSVSRVRLSLDEAGVFHAQAAPLGAPPARWNFRVSPRPIASADLLLRHKTSWRALQDEEAARLDCDEAVFLNERGEVCEGGRSNIFLRRGGRLLTPALSCGLLPGCFRAELLEQGGCEEAVLYPSDLRGEIYFGNSLRGLIKGVPHLSATRSRAADIFPR